MKLVTKTSEPIDNPTHICEVSFKHYDGSLSKPYTYFASPMFEDIKTNTINDLKLASENNLNSEIVMSLKPIDSVQLSESIMYKELSPFIAFKEDNEAMDESNNYSGEIKSFENAYNAKFFGDDLNPEDMKLFRKYTTALQKPDNLNYYVELPVLSTDFVEVENTELSLSDVSLLINVNELSNSKKISIVKGDVVGVKFGDQIDLSKNGSVVFSGYDVPGRLSKYYEKSDSEFLTRLGQKALPKLSIESFSDLFDSSDLSL